MSLFHPLSNAEVKRASSAIQADKLSSLDWVRVPTEKNGEYLSKFLVGLARYRSEVNNYTMTTSIYQNAFGSDPGSNLLLPWCKTDYFQCSTNFKFSSTAKSPDASTISATKNSSAFFILRLNSPAIEFFPISKSDSLNTRRATSILSTAIYPRIQSILVGEFRASDPWLDESIRAWTAMGERFVASTCGDPDIIRLELFNDVHSAVVPREIIYIWNAEFPVVIRRDSIWPTGQLSIQTNLKIPEQIDKNEILSRLTEFELELKSFDGGQSGLAVLQRHVRMEVEHFGLVDQANCNAFDNSTIIASLGPKLPLVGMSGVGENVSYQLDASTNEVVVRDVQGPSYESVQSRHEKNAFDNIRSRRREISTVMICIGLFFGAVVLTRKYRTKQA